MGPSKSDKSFTLRSYAVLARLSPGYPPLQGRFPRITHPCATRVLLHAFDLHVLGMPPAFVLSQDQTLKFASPLWREANLASYVCIDVGIDFLVDALTYGADSAAVRASLPQTHNVKERPDLVRL